MVDHTREQEAAFKADLEKLIPHMRAFARSLCHDAVLGDDLAQDALVRAWSSRQSYTPGTNLKAWVFMILRNGFLSHTRRAWRSCELDPEVAAQTLVAVTSPTSALELNDLRLAMNMLPTEQCEALTLIGAAGLTYDEAAAICDVAVGTIKSRVSRARMRLQEILADGDLRPDSVQPHAAMGAILQHADAISRRAA